MPEVLRLHGTLAWLSGDTKSARQRWKKSLTIAQDLGLPVEQACTLLEMGSRLGDAALVNEATALFSQADAKVYLALALHAQARIAYRSGADITSLLRRYDQAIPALHGVKADYELGVACRQRARLYQQLGHLDRARSDLGKARDCFETVGAALERAEVERQANAITVS
jgi:tetratricopeptide (TPR) repeat protein